MNSRRTRTGRQFTRPATTTVLVACVALVTPYGAIPRAQSAQPQTPAATTATAAPIPPDQLDALVAPIALYPDPLLSQTLVASTYPLEIIQLQQWLAKKKTLKDKALTDAAMKQPWDASIQAMVVLPDVVKRLADDIQWTTDLGNAFLAQQSDVMDAVQRMRKKAQGTGALASNEQQKVETKVIENKTVVIVEQTNPQVVYVPSYSPVVVYGPPIYPYPPIYYPPYPTGAVIATSMISFGVGIAVGAAWGGGWGYHPGWGGNDIDINVNNNFVRNTNINRNTNVNRGGNSTWQHDSSHRGGAPYSNRATADKYGGTARGDSLSSRQSAATRSQPSARTSSSSAARPQTSSSSRTPSTSGANRSAGSTSSASRDVPRSSGSTNKSAFGGSSGSASSAGAASSRGSASRGGGSRGGRGR